MSTHVYSSTENVHLERLKQFVIANKYVKIAELGTHIGGSLLWLAEGVETNGGGEIHAIDYDMNLLNQTKQNFMLRNFQNTTLTLYFGACPETINKLPDDLDFVFVDDLHDARHVAVELDMLLKKVRSGGMIAGHDTNNPPGIGEAFQMRGGYLFPEGFGLGIIKVP